MAKVVIYDGVHEDALAMLKARKGLAVATVTRGDEARLEAEMREADALILRYLPLPRAAIEAAEHLKVIARHGVGYDNIDMDAANAQGVPVATVGDANAVTVAELTLYFMLAASKQGPRHDRMVRDGDWQAREGADAIELYDKNLLVIGFGRIGTRVAARCRAFEMRIHVCDPYIPEARITDQGFTPVADFRAALPTMDVVTVHVPLTDETRHMIDRAALSAMKEGAILINSARGPIVDGEAAGEAIAAGRLFGGGFDVFETEPPAAESALLATPRSVLTPHLGALTKECHRRSALRCAQNSLDAIDGRLDAAFVVNPQVLEPAS